MIKTQGLLHVTISVTDVDRAATFYHDVLGCEEFFRVPIMAFMRSGESNLVLTKMPNHVRPNPEVPSADDIPRDAFLFHHAFIVEPDEFERSKNELRSKGIRFWDCSNDDHSAFGHGNRHLYFYDADGNAIELATNR